MPSKFFKATDNGIVVTDKVILKKTVTIAGVERPVNVQQNIKFGFFAWEGAKALTLAVGDELPVTITDSKIVDQEGNELDICWCNPD